MKKRLLSIFLCLCLMAGLMAVMPISAGAVDIAFPMEDVTVKEGEMVYPKFNLSDKNVMVYSYTVKDSEGKTIASKEFECQDYNKPGYGSFKFQSPGTYYISWQTGGYDDDKWGYNFYTIPNYTNVKNHKQTITVIEDPNKICIVDLTGGINHSRGVFSFGYTREVKVNNTVNLPKMNGLPENLEFVGWYTDEEFTKPFNENTPIRNDMTLYGKMAEKTYTIYFDTMGGKGIEPMKLKYYDKVTLPETTKSGFIFGGWYSDYDLTTPYEKGKVKENHTIYAKWLSEKCIVRFETNCAFSIDNQTVSNGDTLEMPVEPQRENFMFAGWYTDSDFTQAYDFSSPVERNFTLYAKWTTNPFEDVKTSDYFFKPVLWAVDRGVTTGLSETAFGPGSPCTRAQVVTFLWRAAGKPAAGGVNPFEDVKRDAYYYDAVIWAVNNGITTGISANTFGPNEKCTRGQIVTFLWRAQGKNAANAANPFEDVNSEAYFYDAVLWAVDKGVTTGLSESSFGPNSTCTRAQIVTFLYRAMA